MTMPAVKYDLESKASIAKLKLGFCLTRSSSERCQAIKEIKWEKH